MSIIVFQHSEQGSPGRLGLTLRDHGFRLDIRKLYITRGGGVPSDFDNVHGIISLGGEMNVGDAHPWMDDEIAFIKAAHERQLPVIGICLGAQLIAAALGGEVAPMEKPEVGFHCVSLNPNGQTEPMLGGIAWESPAMCTHGQEVTKLPLGATLLGSSKMCKNHVYKVGLRTIAFQSHPECDRAMVEAYWKGDALAASAGVGETELKQQTEKHYAEYVRLADRLCVNIAHLAFPIVKRLSA